MNDKFVVTHFFFLPIDENKYFLELDKTITKLDSPYLDIAKVFRHNLKSLVDTLSVPFSLGLSGVQSSQFQRLHLATRFRANADDIRTGKGTKTSEETVLKNAYKAMDEFIVSKEGLKRMKEDTSAFLKVIYNKADVKIGVSELHRQGIGLLWGSFEVFARDLFASILNARPELARRLMNDSKTKHYFNIKSITFDDFEIYGFNLSQNMGNLLLSLYDLGDVSAIKNIYRVLFSKRKTLQKMLAADDLWLLYQKRNLIVHRRSIVDSQYIEKTGEGLKIGSELSVSPSSIDSYLILIRDLGREFLRAILAVK